MLNPDLAGKMILKRRAKIVNHPNIGALLVLLVVFSSPRWSIFYLRTGRMRRLCPQISWPARRGVSSGCEGAKEYIFPTKWGAKELLRVFQPSDRWYWPSEELGFSWLKITGSEVFQRPVDERNGIKQLSIGKASADHPSFCSSRNRLPPSSTRRPASPWM